METDKELLEAVKNYLDITWADEAGDKKLSGMMQRGMDALNRKGGKRFNYLEEAEPRNLLFQYVMYERSGALHEFWINYRPDIIALQISEGVNRRAAMEEP